MSEGNGAEDQKPVDELLLFQFESFAGNFTGVYDPARALMHIKSNLESYPELSPEQIERFCTSAANFISGRVQSRILESLELLLIETLRHIEVEMKGRVQTPLVENILSNLKTRHQERFLVPKQGRPPKLTRRRLLSAISARKARGEIDSIKGLAAELDEDESTVRKALDHHKIKL